MKAIKFIPIALLSSLILGCATSNLPPANQLQLQNPLSANQLQEVFIGKIFNANVIRGRFGGRYKVEIKEDNKVIIDEGRHYRSWRLEGDKVCIESCFNVYSSDQEPNVYYAIANDRIDLVLKPFR